MHSDFFPKVEEEPKSEWPPERSISFASPSDHQTLVFPLLCEYQVLRAATPHSNTGASHFHAKQEESCILLKTGIILGEKDAKIP